MTESALPKTKTAAPSNPQKTLMQAFANNGALIALILVVVLLLIFSPPFRKPGSVLLIGREVSFIGIVAAGQTFVILTGGIDLSVEAIVAFSGIVAAILISGSAQSGGQAAAGIPAALAIPIAAFAGTMVGVIEGVIITAFNINPFIVTLGFMSILTGVSLTITQGSPINIARDPVMDFIVRSIPIGDFAIPVPLIITLVIYAVIWVLLRRTKLGRYVYAIGGNETAARLSGINVNLIKIIVYGLSGLLASIAGVLLLDHLTTGAYQNGNGYTLLSVATVVIGGTALTGGIGGIWGTLIGVILIRVVESGLVFIGVPSDAQQIVLGTIIVLAVALDVIRRGEVKWLNKAFHRSGS